MTATRWNISDLLVIVLVCGVAFGAYRYFWNPAPDWNAWPYFALFLAFLSTATLGSFCARPRWRRSFQGFAAFGWCDLVFMMSGGFGAVNYDDGQRIAACSQMGVVFGFLCAIVAGWMFEPVSGDPRANHSNEQ
jgi:hypothetical protein